MSKFALLGDLVWAPQQDTIKEIKNGFIVVENGIITNITKKKPDGLKIVDYSNKLIIPGFVDLHLHAPQYGFAGLFMDEELLDWLNIHTFPEESKFKNTSHGKKAYSIFVRDLKKSPTTRAVIFGTIHTDSTILLMKLMEKSGLVSYVGKVNMVRNAPDYLCESLEESISETYRYIELSKNFKRTKAIITPRFVPTCSDELLTKLGEIAKEKNLPIQSHLSENPMEIKWVKELQPTSTCYGHAYERFGLMTNKTIMAHGVWPSETEYDLLKKTGCFIAHSPESNMNLASGIAPLRSYLNKGINIGLATDVAGGSSLSMIKAMTLAIQNSKLYWRYIDNKCKPISFTEGFWLGTKAGGSFFGKVGSFEEGYDGDFIVLDDDIKNESILKLTPAQRLEFYCYRHQEKEPVAKYVMGKQLF
ncbi:MAG: amidohydrolase family protein [Sphaerochaetaceae bacterium]|nr:amidohydrolase family protein [Sphaerochaetaceae bacterium]